MLINSRSFTRVAFSTLLLSLSVSGLEARAASDINPYTDDAIRGVVMPIDEAVLATDLVATISRLPFREGEAFQKDQILIAFDCSRYKAELSAAWSAHTAYRKTFQTNKELESYDAIGKHEVAVSRAEMNRAASQANAIAARTKQCEIKAPWSGRVVETMIHQHETPAANQPLLKIINDSVLELDLIVPSRWLVWLDEGTQFRFSVDETGKTYDARVKQIGATVDAVSQTIKIKGVFDGKPQRVLPGMSGFAQFDKPAS